MIFFWQPSKRQEGQYYSAIVVFNSPEEANQAFENIAGELGKVFLASSLWSFRRGVIYIISFHVLSFTGFYRFVAKTGLSTTESMFRT